MENKTKIWLAAGGCAALLAFGLLALLAGAWAWQHYRAAAPPAGPAAAADTSPAAGGQRAVLQGIAATLPQYTIMGADQRAACSAVFAQLLTAQAAGRLAPAEFDQLIDVWAALLADNAVTADEVAGLQQLAASAAAD